MIDVIVIGAGITGTAIARELSKYQIDVMVVEKSYDIANGATKANSGIVHAGYDAKEGTLKAKLNVMGNEMYEDLCKELDVDFIRNGSLVIAFSDEEMKHVEKLYERGIRNGVKELEIIDGEQLRKIEPNISENAVGALHAKTGGIVSPYELAIALAEIAFQNGVKFQFQTEVRNIKRREDYFIVETSRGNIEAKYVVNAAGLFADEINRMLGGKEFRIIPRKGEYCLLDKTQGKHVKNTIFQVPTSKGKGILVSPTVHGNLLLGPNAVEIYEKDDTSTTFEGLDEVIKGAQRSVRNINLRDVITSFTGVRATPDTGDFIINSPSKGAVNAAGIESPGLTSAPAVALMVLDLLREQGLILNKKENFNPKRVKPRRFIDMNQEEKEQALKENKLYGRVICRCEHITEGDIINAIYRPLGARTVDGVKKRLRAGMGRCQGGFCMPRVVEILARELKVEPEEILKAGEGSKILTGRTK
ncbi:NAD(P)/FAD-dependent oxidoreductase [Fonticella tunisiensis]|uniref:Glycerol-3-phosphate dehydrogenase n=1 Tax=Fonticella tunisiensis TaxID=1096341 RepID=A0A4R7KTY6_9CLOT|nr:NAD(P)/FAD-dependent oxidoreductase [Fonticella tunisiensis]TDT61368.1 glycerol-3-phosphate dehydrogenase [Fonticella tunisiensis]